MGVVIKTKKKTDTQVNLGKIFHDKHTNTLNEPRASFSPFYILLFTTSDAASSMWTSQIFTGNISLDRKLRKWRSLIEDDDDDDEIRGGVWQCASGWGHKFSHRFTRSSFCFYVFKTKKKRDKHQEIWSSSAAHQTKFQAVSKICFIFLFLYILKPLFNLEPFATNHIYCVPVSFDTE